MLHLFDMLTVYFALFLLNNITPSLLLVTPYTGQYLPCDLKKLIKDQSVCNNKVSVLICIVPVHSWGLLSTRLRYFFLPRVTVGQQKSQTATNGEAADLRRSSGGSPRQSSRPQAPCERGPRPTAHLRHVSGPPVLPRGRASFFTRTVI